MDRHRIEAHGAPGDTSRGTLKGVGQQLGRIPLTTLTMMAARAPHQNVSISNSGNDPVGHVEHQDVDQEVEDPERNDDERDREHCEIGLIQALTTVKTAAAMSSVHHWSP